MDTSLDKLNLVDQMCNTGLGSAFHVPENVLGCMPNRLLFTWPSISVKELE